MILVAFESRVVDVVLAKLRGINNTPTVDVELHVVPKTCSPIARQMGQLT